MILPNDRLPPFPPSVQALLKRHGETLETLRQAADAAGRVTVDAIELRLRGMGIGRAEIIATLKKLESRAPELGRFVTGRRGSISRFEWHLNEVEPAKAASDNADRLTPPPENGGHDAGPATGATDAVGRASAAGASATETSAAGASMPADLRHRFPLRPGYLAELQLPIDLTEREADKLAAFIKSLAQ